MSRIQRPSRSQVLVFRTSDDLRAWFEGNHATAAEAWIGYYRKGVGKTSIRWADAVDQALCFGWIDGISYRIDDEVTANRFTPRRPTSGWSAVNLANMARLEAAGQVHPSGRRAFEARDRRKDQVDPRNQPRPALPREWQARLEAGETAEHWQAQPPGYRRNAIEWVMAAKRQETRERRFAALLRETLRGSRPGPFRIGDS